MECACGNLLHHGLRPRKLPCHDMDMSMSALPETKASALNAQKVWGPCQVPDFL